MAAKDLYNILQVPSTATITEIKKAYRKLALQYHPDKNHDNELAVNHFLEIKKAYEILGNAAKRQQYNYDNRQRKRNAQTSAEPVSPQFILQKINELARHINDIDIFRMSQAALYLQIIEILTDKNIAILKYYQDKAINKKIVESTLKTIQPLSFNHIKKLEPVLIKIADNDTAQLIRTYIKHKKKIDFWDKYNFVIILIITIVICLIIFSGGN